MFGFIKSVFVGSRVTFIPTAFIKPTAAPVARRLPVNCVNAAFRAVGLTAGFNICHGLNIWIVPATFRGAKKRVLKTGPAFSNGPRLPRPEKLLTTAPKSLLTRDPILVSSPPRRAAFKRSMKRWNRI
jgi:hypothetical protein